MGQARRPPDPTPPWTWFLNANIGLVGREIATWKPAHNALAPSGWDSQYQFNCIYLCQNSSDPAEGRPIATMISVRRQVSEEWQLRLMGAMASPGYYPGSYQGIPLTIRPTTATVSAQLVRTLKAFWFAAGPSYYRGRLATSADTSRTTSRGSGVGFVVTGAATFPRMTNWYVEMMIERRVAGSLTSTLMPVAGAPDVPPVRVPLSATVLSVGVGWRL